ncbi:MAG: hypothetical protein JW744_01245 [Candidatus Diapherotrites archaeon]|uniref:Uncharacterized protein n=1 Tax=Candidatus Iainarchaeum sp. TaxID=3101447 RepID=A0A938YMT7_9ARCH|nr:hypothetical protein [Candidatus Diapherotrites archaeon]
MRKDPLKLKPRAKLPEMLHMAQLHYHLAPAGVRVVMENTIDSMLSFEKKRKISIFVLASAWAAPKPDDLKIRSDFKKLKNAEVRIIDIPEIDYDSKQYKSREKFLERAKKLKEKIVKQLPLEKCSAKSPFILHCHGLPLGKNPALNYAIKLLAEQCERMKTPLWILNQVHDFAENGRPEMLLTLQYCTGKRDETFAAEIMYPNTRNIFYATINSRDAENLRTAGISEKRIFFLPNSIDTGFFSGKAITSKKKFKKQLIEEIRDYSMRSKYFFNPKRKIILSPLKCMRRKNNAESILLLKAFNYLDDKFQLIITLDAHSGPDVKYSRKVRRFVRQEGIPVVIGVGTDVTSSSEERGKYAGKVTKFSIVDLFAVSKAVMTTSMIEGFGFAFHEGWITGTPVIGRKIHYVCRDFERNGLKLGHMYKKLFVDVQWVGNCEKRLFKIFFNDVNELRKKQEMKALAKKKMLREINRTKYYRVKGSKCVDFKELSIEMQLEAIREIFKDEKNVKKFLSLNPSVGRMLKMLQKKPAELVRHNRKIVMKKYSLRAKAKRLRHIYAIGTANYLKKVKDKKIDNRKVIDKYLDLDYIHPLAMGK